jgi:hypothetical protein
MMTRLLGRRRLAEMATVEQGALHETQPSDEDGASVGAKVSGEADIRI